MPNAAIRHLRSAPARTRARAAAFRRAEDGSVFFFSIIMFLGMLALAGVAIDFMRFEMTRTKLQNTLDRAVLAATELGQSLEPEDVVADYFEKAGMAQYLGDITVLENESSGTLSYRRVNVKAEATIETLLLHLVHINDLTVTANGTAEEGITDLEVSLVVDVSGSMGSSSSSGKTKIYELKQAAKDFAYYMQCNPTAERGSGEECTVDHGKVSITLVPYSEQVNVGEQLLDYFSVTSEHDLSHCVTFEPEMFEDAAIDLDETPPLKRTGHFDPWQDYNDVPGQWTCRTEGWREIQLMRDDYEEVFDLIDRLSAGGNTSIDLGMKWGTALLDPEARDIVNDLITTPVAPGATETVIDVKFLDRPYDYDQDYNMKVIVLMTDGMNTNQHYLRDGYRSGGSGVWHYREADGSPGDEIYSVYNAGEDKYRWVRASGNDYESSWQSEPYKGESPQTCSYEWVKLRGWWGGYYWEKEWVCVDDGEADGVPYELDFTELWQLFTTDWYDRFWWLSNPVAYYGNSDKNDRLHEICDAAKDQGILVYTIGFEVGTGSNAETVMKDCASTDLHYFPANGSNLAEVFAIIATSINQLRLTQ